ncbi:MAG: hypothetical protein DRK00_07375 [Thermoprotei archaeon]|nr:MAG: hypothetical protein DRK00_07375 [Thermoprotei archaeon]
MPVVKVRVEVGGEEYSCTLGSRLGEEVEISGELEERYGGRLEEFPYKLSSRNLEDIKARLLALAL